MSKADHGRTIICTGAMLAVVATGLFGCAGSADHDILATYEAKDSTLDCVGLKQEILKAQDVINAVEEDREDISGADVIDGVLYFPFNLIAKSSNYKNAVEAAAGRIERLEELRKERDCPE